MKVVRDVDIKVGDKVKTKKKHPCGGDTWEVTRVGMDVKLRCISCGHEVMLPRKKAEVSIKEIM